VSKKCKALISKNTCQAIKLSFLTKSAFIFMGLAFTSIFTTLVNSKISNSIDMSVGCPQFRKGKQVFAFDCQQMKWD
jgi:hypothetical protein